MNDDLCIGFKQLAKRFVNMFRLRVLLFLSASVRDMARRLDEVEKNLRHSPTPSIERDLRQQIDDLRESKSQLTQQLDAMTAKNLELQKELRLKSKELSDAREEIEKQRRDAEATETALKVQLEGSIEVGRLLKLQLDQAAVRENLLRQEVRQAVQDERTQLTVLATDVTSTPSDQTGACIA